MFIGEELILTWNTAKKLGDELASGCAIRIEAFGKDWVVVRTATGSPMSACFATHREFFDWYNALERYEDSTL